MALYKLAAKSLLALLTYDYNQKLERFKKFIETKLEEDEEENIDIYFKHIGDNFYAKNYIGFKNAKDINKFLKFDYNIMKKKFPTNTACILALISVIIVSLLFVALLIILSIKEGEKISICIYLFINLL